MNYAIYEIDGPVWGVGETKLQAFKSALEWWIEAPVQIQDVEKATMGDAVCIPCSETVAQAVNDLGGIHPMEIEIVGGVLIEKGE